MLVSLIGTGLRGPRPIHSTRPFYGAVKIDFGYCCGEELPIDSRARMVLGFRVLLTWDCEDLSTLRIHSAGWDFVRHCG